MAVVFLLFSNFAILKAIGLGALARTPTRRSTGS